MVAQAPGEPVPGAPRYTHGHAESVLRSHRWRTAENSAAHLLPHLAAGDRLLDVGSGPGTITADLAERVSPGRVTALEVTEEAADLTRAELDRRAVEHATVKVGDVHALPFTDDSFDVVHAHQVLQHVADPVMALREMARVTHPGGIVAVRDSDYHGFVWSPESPAIDRWLELYDAAARGNGGQPDAGRMLLGWAIEAGLTDVTATSSTWCFADPDDRAWWAGLWAERVTSTALAEQLLAQGLATSEELAEIAEGWRAWATEPGGWFSVLHGELVIRV
ncbi:MAG: methyltransferase domain-containing protein [Nocardioidaceae bacterium]|nr:methyltransferase domain-containing protein [Nocardioidaceae bacterium]